MMYLCTGCDTKTFVGSYYPELLCMECGGVMRPTFSREENTDNNEEVDSGEL